MSQNDFTIANQGFPAFRADLNSALQALASNSSGTSAPSTTFANMWWYDSSNNIMYIRNEDNDAWIKFAELDQTNDKFVLSGTLQLDDGTVSAPALTFNSDTNMGIYRGGTDILKFVTAGTDAVTIDASQNFLVGTTTILTAENNVEGISLASGSYGGLISASRDGGRVATLNRSTSNGDIIEFRKNGTAVGSIGTSSGFLYAGHDDVGLIFRSNESIRPYNPSTTSERDAQIDLGVGGVRFKDLYLSGGVYLGGTGSSNKIDDVETGTWTPVLRNSDPTTGTVVGTSNNNSSYVKIGNLVHANLYIQRNDASSLTSQLFVTNLPFTSDNYPAPNGSAWFDNTSSDWRTFTYTSPNATILYFILAGNSNDAINTNNWDNSRYIYCAFTYRTT